MSPHAFLDIQIQPQFEGLPPHIQAGLVHLTNNLSAVLILASGAGIVLSILGLLVGHWLGSHALHERFKSSLLLSALAGALLFGSVSVANYATALFR